MLRKVLFVYEFVGRTATEVGKVNRQLFGYTDKSHHGKYTYQRPGLLTKFEFVRLARGVILTDRSNDEQVLEALRKVGAKKITRLYLVLEKKANS